jgi:asparagine synthase (glutamine-hydrolysing)
MCGIWSYIQLCKKNGLSLDNLFSDFMKMKGRGPDMSVFQTFRDNVAIGFHRLAIMDPTFHANQPYILEDGDRTVVFICNGEIYNFKELIEKHSLPISTNSDCMTIPRLYLKYVSYNENGPNYLNTFSDLFKTDIKGEFAFVLLEFDRLQNIKEIVTGRDQIGVRPLYVGLSETSIIFSSEVKGMTSFNHPITEFKPGHINHLSVDSLRNVIYNHNHYFREVYEVEQVVQKEEKILQNVRNAVINSVKRRLTADRPIAFLLSGGVDSSLVASLSARILGQPIRTFCCGMNEGTDLLYARKVAKHIGSNHTEVFFTPEEGVQAIRDVIYTTETWDTTSIRASVGQYLVCKHIGTKTDARVVLVGEGPDEVCSSYLFNYYAKDGKSLHECALEYVQKIHLFDGRRVDRNVSRFGLEARVPLLDPEFIEAYWKIPSELRRPQSRGIEKYWLRAAFEDMDLLPEEVRMRKKEAFSDGVSSKERSWFQILQDFINEQVSEEEFLSNNKWNCVTKEQYYYKKIFCEYFGEDRLNIIPHYWQAKFLDDGTVVDFSSTYTYKDPSARTLSVYKKE